MALIYVDVNTILLYITLCQCVGVDMLQFTCVMVIHINM